MPGKPKLFNCFQGSIKLGELKHCLCEKHGVPVVEEILMYGTQRLFDQHTLQYYNVHNYNLLGLYFATRNVGGSNFYDLVSECSECPKIGPCAMLIRHGKISYIQMQVMAHGLYCVVPSTLNVQ